MFKENIAFVEINNERAYVSNNLLPISGALSWTAELLVRIKDPIYHNQFKIEKNIKAFKNLLKFPCIN